NRAQAVLWTVVDARRLQPSGRRRGRHRARSGNGGAGRGGCTGGRPGESARRGRRPGRRHAHRIAAGTRAGGGPGGAARSRLPARRRGHARGSLPVRPSVLVSVEAGFGVRRAERTLAALAPLRHRLRSAALTREQTTITVAADSPGVAQSAWTEASKVAARAG